MDIIKDIASLFGIISVILSSINYFFISIIKSFWRLTFDKKVEEDKVRFEKIEEDLNKIKTELKSDVRSLEENIKKSIKEHITSEIEHLKELIELKFALLKDKR